MKDCYRKFNQDGQLTMANKIRKRGKEQEMRARGAAMTKITAKERLAGRVWRAQMLQTFPQSRRSILGRG